MSKRTHYVDGPWHGVPKAESGYRQGFLAAFHLMTNDPDDFSFQITATIQSRQALRFFARTNPSKLPPDPTSEAALMRGYQHGLVSAYDAIQESGQDCLQRWLLLVIDWSDGDCCELIPPPPCPG